MVASFRSVAHAAATLGGDPVCNVPAGVQNGDLLLAFCTSTVAAWTPPAGWTAHPTSAGGVAPLFQRIASSEPANYTFVASGAGNNSVTIVAIKDVAAATPAEAGSNSGVVGSGNIVIPTVTSGGANRLLFQMVCRAGGSGTFTPPGTAAERYDTVVAPTTFTAAGGDETVGAGATGTRTWVPSSSGAAIGYMVAIAPVSPGDLAGSTPKVTAALVGGLDGNVAGQTPTAAAAMAGTLPGDAAGTIPASAASLVGVLPGDMAGQSAPVSASLVGAITGVLDPSTPRAQAALDGTYTPPDFGSGALAAAIPAATVDLAGDYLQPPGVLAGNIPTATISLAGSIDGALAATAAKSTGSLVGSYEEPNPGDLVATTAPATAVLVGSLAGTLAGTTPAATAALTGRLNYQPRHHRATVRELARTHAVGEVAQSHTVGEQSRKTTVMEGIA
jgi:hypothetical protein